MIETMGGDDDGDFGMTVCANADAEAGAEELACKLGPFAESVDDEGQRRFSVIWCGPHEGTGFGHDFVPKFDTVDDDGLLQGTGRTESGAEGFELQIDGRRAKSIKPAFADGNEVGVFVILIDDVQKIFDTTFGEMPGMQLDAVVLLLLGGLVAIGRNDKTHPLGGYREDGSRTAGSVGVYVGKGEQWGRWG